jgi:hypothetical protein
MRAEPRVGLLLKGIFLFGFNLNWNFPKIFNENLPYRILKKNVSNDLAAVLGHTWTDRHDLHIRPFLLRCKEFLKGTNLYDEVFNGND